MTHHRVATPDAIFQMAYGFMAAKTLMVSNELGLFEHLAAGPATLSELTERMQVPSRSVQVLANAMVALGLLELSDGRYRNGAVAQAYLSGETAADLRPMLRFMNHITYPQWAHLEEAARVGRPAMPAGQFSNEMRQIYSAGMEAITAGTVEALIAAYDFGQYRRVLDLGGGIGSFLAAIAREHPHIHATLFEMPDVAALARPYLDRRPGAARIDVVTGNFFIDPIPSDHDAIIVANVVHQLSPAENMTLLERIRAKALAGAHVLLIDFWTDSTHTQPPIAALTAAQFLITSEGGGVYSQNEVATWLTNTNWRLLHHTPLNGAASLIVAEAR